MYPSPSKYLCQVKHILLQDSPVGSYRLTSNFHMSVYTVLQKARDGRLPIHPISPGPTFELLPVYLYRHGSMASAEPMWLENPKEPF